MIGEHTTIALCNPSELERMLGELRRGYEELLAERTAEELAGPLARGEEPELRARLDALLEVARELPAQLGPGIAEIVLGPAPCDPALLDFYHEVFLPREDELQRLHDSLPCAPRRDASGAGIGAGSAESMPLRVLITSHLLALQKVYESSAVEMTALFNAETAATAFALASYDFFQPDLWRANALRMRALAARRPLPPLAPALRSEFEELGRALVLGCSSAVLALAQSILLRVLGERFADAAGEPGADAARGPRPLDSKVLAERCARHFPALAQPLRTVLDNGRRCAEGPLSIDAPPDSDEERRAAAFEVFAALRCVVSVLAKAGGFTGR